MRNKKKTNTNANALSRVPIVHHNEVTEDPHRPSTSNDNVDLTDLNIRTLLGIPTTPNIIKKSQENQEQRTLTPQVIETVTDQAFDSNPVGTATYKIPEID